MPRSLSDYIDKKEDVKKADMIQARARENLCEGMVSDLKALNPDFDIKFFISKTLKDLDLSSKEKLKVKISSLTRVAPSEIYAQSTDPFAPIPWDEF